MSNGNYNPTPEGVVEADGYVYKVHYAAGTEVVPDAVIAQALSEFGVVRVAAVTAGGKSVFINPNNQKEQA